MPKKEDVPLKGKYRLWWEFFKRSDLYNRLKEKAICFFEQKENSVKEWRLAVQEEIRKDKTINCHSFRFFQELIEGKSIDEWWKINPWLANVRNPRVLDITEECASVFSYYQEVEIGILEPGTKWKTIDGREVKKGDSQEQVKVLIMPPLKNDLIISISGLRFWDQNQLEKEIRKIVTKRKQKTRDSYALSFSLGKLEYEKISRYLEVYDRVKSLKGKKLSWEKITREFYAPLAKRIEEKDLTIKAFERIIRRLSSHERRLYLEYAKARKIMKNTEKGIFPGNYS